jgi:hypothetical protein
MTSLLVGFVVNAVVGLAIGVAASRYVWRRARKQERAHRMRIGLFDRAGERWLDIDCEQLGVWYRYGALDRGHDGWAELQQIGEVSLRARPVADR